MAELCIVCLGELRTSIAEDSPPEDPDGASTLYDTAFPSHDAARNTRSTATSIETDEEAIAHLLPCKHDLHHVCLKPWVERANSCPICRAKFNMVELSRAVAGPVEESYAVRDKVQEAEVDPTMIIEDELFAIEAWEPCLVCGSADDVHETMYCDGCDKAVHVFCAGFDDAPDVWYCETCLNDLESEIGLPGMASAMRTRSRGRPAGAQRRRRHNPDAVWARVWQEVSRRLDLDLDFPFDDEPQDHRTDEQRREFARWRRRFEVADRHGANNRLREIANTQIRPANGTAPLDPESQEELRAWNAFEKARESQDAPASVRRRKRKATASPASPSEPEPSERPPQKRPRLRRPINHSDSHPIAESSHTAAQRSRDEPTFLSSLLREVESKPMSASSPGATEFHHGQYSPREMSPMLSPSSSGCGTPRALSPQRPLSPPLSSTHIPTSPPDLGTFSPFSPVAFSQDSRPSKDTRRRGRRPLPADSLSSGDERMPKFRHSSISPSRNLSYSAKEELQRMVKLALGSRYRDKEITKDQYTEINRDVSRKLYDLVGDASALTDQTEREKWQGVADDEVMKAIATLTQAASPASE